MKIISPQIAWRYRCASESKIIPIMLTFSHDIIDSMEIQMSQHEQDNSYKEHLPIGNIQFQMCQHEQDNSYNAHFLSSQIAQSSRCASASRIIPITFSHHRQHRVRDVLARAEYLSMIYSLWNIWQGHTILHRQSVYIFQ